MNFYVKKRWKIIDKIIILADTHLIHSYHRDYDKISEFKRLVKNFMSYKPSSVIILGDFIDKKLRFQGHPISYVDGSKHQISIVKIIKSTKINWYALLGNHEDKYILKSVSEAADNFYYMETESEKILKQVERLAEDNPLETDNLLFWFANIDTNESYLEIERKINIFCQAVSQYPNHNKKNILLTHLDFAKKGNIGLENKLLKVISASFDLTLNGHEHTYKKKFKFENIVFVPPSIPTWVSMGSGSIQNFSFEKDQLVPKTKLKTPHGYLLLDSETLTHEFIPFKPKMPTVEVLYNVTDKDLSQIDTDWRKVAEVASSLLIGKEEIRAIIIIPVFTGNMENLYKIDVDRILQIITNDFENLYIVDIKEKDLVTTSLSTNRLEDEEEITNIEKVFTKTIEQVDEIQEQLKDKRIDISIDDLVRIIQRMKTQDNKFFYRREGKSIHQYISNIVEQSLPQFNEILESNYSLIDIVNILEETLQRRGK